MGRRGWESRVGGSRFGQDAKAGEESSWDQQGVRLQLGCHPSCCVTSARSWPILGPSGQHGSLVLYLRPVPTGASLCRAKTLGLFRSFLGIWLFVGEQELVPGLSEWRQGSSCRLHESIHTSRRVMPL